jgi:hypothetical protein
MANDTKELLFAEHLKYELEMFDEAARFLDSPQFAALDRTKRDQWFWPAPGSEDTELGVLMELEVGHGETEVYAGVQA